MNNHKHKHKTWTITNKQSHTHTYTHTHIHTNTVLNCSLFKPSKLKPAVALTLCLRPNVSCCHLRSFCSFVSIFSHLPIFRFATLALAWQNLGGWATAVCVCVFPGSHLLSRPLISTAFSKRPDTRPDTRVAFHTLTFSPASYPNALLPDTFPALAGARKYAWGALGDVFVHSRLVYLSLFASTLKAFCSVGFSSQKLKFCANERGSRCRLRAIRGSKVPFCFKKRCAVWGRNRCGEVLCCFCRNFSILKRDFDEI